MMVLQPKIVTTIASRTFKNFGHKRQPIPFVTTLWHGFLTVSLIGMGLNWDKFYIWVFGEDTKPKFDWDTPMEETYGVEE